jgi:threonylcarbamoyladenosine tRNA methylthiotransferase MtaB
MRVRLDSIGCRLNISEIEAIARDLRAAGHELVGVGETADLCIFNSCTVTAVADRKSRHILRQLRRSHPDATIVATGCFAELSANDAHDAGVDLVVGNSDKDRLPALLREKGILPGRRSDDDADGRIRDPQEPGRTRAFLKVQDGCDNRCTFCVVTIARGAGRSRPPAGIVSEVQQLVDLGYLEVVLSGVHLGSYGHDLSDSRGLETLIRRILDETEVPRIRLSSLEPWDLDRGFFELFTDERLLPHLHIPLQSGCDSTLERMARRTDRGRFAALIEAARSIIPDVSISTDIMVGFPGETDEEFSDSLEFVETMAFSRLHIFRFSPREGTRAAEMPGRIPGDVAQDRSRTLHAVAGRAEHSFHRRFVGDTRPVLWERREDLGGGSRWSGLTDNYIRTVTETGAEIDLENRITKTEIVSTIPGGVLGRVDGLTFAHLGVSKSRRTLPMIDE